MENEKKKGGRKLRNYKMKHLSRTLMSYKALFGGGENREKEKKILNFSSLLLEKSSKFFENFSSFLLFSPLSCKG